VGNQVLAVLLLVAGLSMVGLGTWLIANRARLDAEGERELGNRYMSAGFRGGALVATGMLAVPGAIYFLATH
jgi:hypothetical protein